MTKARTAKRKTKTAVRDQGQLGAETLRVGTLLDDTILRLHDPRVGLPQRMRLNLLRTELEAYLRGLRFALGEIDESATPEYQQWGHGQMQRVS